MPASHPFAPSHWLCLPRQSRRTLGCSGTSRGSAAGEKQGAVEKQGLSPGGSGRGGQPATWCA